MKIQLRVQYNLDHINQIYKSKNSNKNEKYIILFSIAFSNLEV